jgi:hypothetical protein
MTRIVAVALLAAMCVALFGIDRTALAAAQQTTSDELARQLARVEVGDIVNVVRQDGTKLRGVLVAKTADSITIDVYRSRAFRRPQLVATEALDLASVREVTTPLSSGQKAAIVAGVVAGAVGVCTAAYFGERRPRLDGTGSTGEAQSPAGHTPTAQESEFPPEENQATEAR